MMAILPDWGQLTSAKGYMLPCSNGIKRNMPPASGCLHSACLIKM
ncbi:hypothetical protein [Paenibacillus sp. 1_12]|nr:hypothetical protein [Paenibacillus sp. 1_12]